MPDTALPRNKHNNESSVFGDEMIAEFAPERTAASGASYSSATDSVFGDEMIAEFAPERKKQRQAGAVMPKSKKQVEQRGFLAETGSALGSGFVSVGEALTSTAEMAGLPGADKASGFLRGLQETDALRRPDYLQQGTVLDEPGRLTDWRWWTRTVGENLPSALSMLVPAGAVSKIGTAYQWGDKARRAAALGAGLTASWPLETGGAYSSAKQEMIQSGKYDADTIERIATAEGLVAGTANSIIELLPIDSLLFKQSGADRLLKRILRQGLIEGGTETIQESVNMLVEQQGHQPDRTTKDMIGRAIEAGLGGAVIGGGFGATFGTAAHRADNKNYNNIAAQSGLKDDIKAWKADGLPDKDIAARAATRLKEYNDVLLPQINSGLPPDQHMPPVPQVNAEQMVSYVLYGDGQLKPATGAGSDHVNKAKETVLRSMGMKPKSSEQPSARPQPDAAPLTTSAIASQTIVTEGQRQAALDEEKAKTNKSKASALLAALTNEDMNDQQALEQARQEDNARRDEQTALLAAQQQAQQNAAVAAAEAQHAQLKTELASDNPRKQAIVDDVAGLSERTLISAIQKELRLTVSPAGPGVYALDTPQGPAPVDLSGLRERLAAERIKRFDRTTSQAAADAAALRKMEMEQTDKKEQKAAAAVLRMTRQALMTGATLSSEQRDLLAAQRDQLTPKEIERLDKPQAKAPLAVTMTSGMPKPAAPSPVITETTNPEARPVSRPEHDDTPVLIDIMLSDLDNSRRGGELVENEETGETTRSTAGINWLAAVNKGGMTVTRADARAALTKAQNNGTLTPRQQEIYAAIIAEARASAGNHLSEAIYWGEKGFVPSREKQAAVNDMVEGDRFVIDNEEFRVTDVDDAGNVTLKDGTIKKVKEGTVISGVDFIRPAEVAMDFNTEDFVPAQKEAPHQSGGRPLPHIPHNTPAGAVGKPEGLSGGQTENLGSSDNITPLPNSVKPVQTEFGAENKIFTEDKAARAREILKKKLDGTQLNAGIDPEMLMAGMDLAGFYIEGGLKKFAKFSIKMVEDVGENIRPYLKSFYLAIRNYPGFDNTGMDTEADLNKAGHVATAAKTPEERRHNLDTRKKVADMTDAEKAAALLTDTKTGLRNERAFEEAPRKAHIAYLDGDSLGAINDNFGHDAGDAIIKVWGEALRYAGIPETYHLHGDELAMEAASKEAIDSAMQRAYSYLDEHPILVISIKDGNKYLLNGGMSYGIGTDKQTADAALYANKQHRLATGQRAAKGDLPRGLRRADARVGRDNDQRPILPENKEVTTTSPPAAPPASVQLTTGLVPQNETKKATPVADKPINNTNAVALDFAGKIFATAKNNGTDEIFTLSLRPDNSVTGAFSVIIKNSEGNSSTARMQYAAGMPIAALIKDFQYYLNIDNAGMFTVEAGTIKEQTEKKGNPPAAAKTSGNLDAYGLTVTKGTTNTGKTVWNVAGPETRTWKDTIKKVGGRWYGPKKVWSFAIADPTADLLAALPPKDQLHPSIKAAASQEESAPPMPVAETKSPPPNYIDKAKTEDYNNNEDAKEANHAIHDQSKAQAANDRAGVEGQSSPDLPGNEESRNADAVHRGLRRGDARELQSTVGRPAIRSAEAEARALRSSAAGASPILRTEPGMGRDNGDMARIRRSGSPERGADHVITAAGIERHGSWLDTAHNNLDIIELAKTIAAEKRPATPAEQARLARYTGFGASEIANKMFPGWAEKGQILLWQADRLWKPLVERMTRLLTPQELATAAQSTQYAHYTSAEIIDSIYKALGRFGFAGGRVLEPGMGVGSFLGLMPETMRATSVYTGIEMDGITAQIAKLLYPNQNIIEGDYTKQQFPNNFFDLGIGNPPFSKTKIMTDPDYKKMRLSLHDFFFVKSLDKIRPGGLMVFITSRYTMDKKDNRVRGILNGQADLLGAIRLPQTAFKHNAGTDVVTDVLFLRKKAPGEQTAGQRFADVDAVQTPEGEFHVNEYFTAHPGMVLGSHSGKGKMYGLSDQYTVLPVPGQGNIEDMFAAAAANLPADVYSMSHAAPAQQEAAAIEKDFNPQNKKEGGIYLSGKGEVMITEQGAGVPITTLHPKLTPKDKRWLAGYIELRGALKQCQYDQLTEGNWEKSLQELNRVYATFKLAHGRLTEFTLIERKETDEDGNEIRVPFRKYVNENLLELDVEAALVAALEYTTEDHKISNGPFLTGRTIKKPEPPQIKTAPDALAVSLNEKGKLDIAHIAALLGQPVADVAEQLGDLVYDTPDKGFVLADEYLSGNVVSRLAEARAATKLDNKYQRNVDALLKAQPVPLSSKDVTVSAGASWVPRSVYNDFIREVLELPQQATVAHSTADNQWTINGIRPQSMRGRASEWCTPERGANEIFDAVLNNSTIKIYQTHKVNGADVTTIDAAATAQANTVAKKMRSRFRTWVWEDANRASSILDIYNTTRNNIVPRRSDGAHLTLPGVSLRFTLLPHQKDAIWRIIQSGNTYIAHAVGAGKTYEMVAAGMEMKRLGLVKKPLYVVPNHMLKQFANEFQDLYPMAHIMVADNKNFHTSNRRRFMAQAALNNPDAVIITHSAFGLLKMKEENIAPVRNETITELRLAHADLSKEKTANRIRIKQVERQIDQVTQRFDAMLAKGDNVMTFEDMGVDFLFVDEAHQFRKLDFTTNRQAKGIDPQGSVRAMDLYIKTKWLGSQNPGRSHVFASGTPVTNTMGELYTIMKFFVPDQMIKDDIDYFDAWATDFGEMASTPEMNAAGRYEIVDRFSKFINVPELMSRVRMFMDVLTSSHLGAFVARPAISGGQPTVVVTPAPAGLKDYQNNVLQERIKNSKAWKPSPAQPGNPDPLINIITDGRLASIDLRFVQPGAPNDPDSKLNKFIDKIIELHEKTKDNTYIDPATGKEAYTRGAAQVAFYNHGFGQQTAQTRGFDARAWAMQRFKDAGIKTSEIAWINDYDTPAQKEAMMKEVRSGTKRILLGSAKKMGTGMNVQTRLGNLTYLDPPWYPSDVEQPLGRIIRQGNQHKEAGVYYFATKGSYDATMWQMVTRKAKFIEDAMAGGSARSIEDISESSLYEMAAALASGDERAIQLAGLNADINNLENLRGAHYSGQKRLAQEKERLEFWMPSRHDRVADLAAASKKAPAGLGYAMIMTDTKIGTVNYSDKKAFGEALRDKIAALRKEDKEGKTPIGTFFGLEMVVAQAQQGNTEVFRAGELDTVAGHMVNQLQLHVTDKVSYEVASDISENADAPGLVTRLTNRARSVHTDLSTAETALADAQKEFKKINARLGAPFEFAQELQEKVADAVQIVQALEAESNAHAPQVATHVHEGLDTPYGRSVKYNHEEIQDTGMPADRPDTVREEYDPLFGDGGAYIPSPRYPKVTTRKVGTFKAEKDTITSAQDLANLAATNLSQYPQEQFVSVTTGKDGKILSIYRHTTGSKAKSMVEQEVVAGQVLNTPGAKDVWLIHNHPSAGETKFSREDRNVADGLANLLHGTGVEMSDFLAISSTNHYVSLFSSDGQGKIASGERSTKLPTVERIFKTTGANLQKITEPADVIRIGKQALPEGGILLANNQNQVVGVLSVSDYSLLRGAGQVDLLRSIEKAGAGSLVIYEPRKTVTSDEALNLKRFVNAAGIKILDIVDSTGSFLEQGKLSVEPGREFLSVDSENTDSPAGRDSAPEPNPQRLGAVALDNMVSGLTHLLKGVKVTKRGGEIWLETKTGDDVRVVAAESIDPDHVQLTIEKHYAQEAKHNRRIAGMYTRGDGPALQNTITLVKNVAGIWTLSHEFYHFLEDIGAISSADKALLNQKIAYLIARNPQTYGVLKGRSAPEQRAEYVGRALVGIYDPQTPSGKIIEKIKNVIDKIINALGIRTARSVIRDIETGKIYENQATGRKYTEENMVERSFANETDPHNQGIQEFITISLHDKTYKENRNIGEVTKQEIADIQTAIGEDATGAYHEITSEHIRHAYNSHHSAAIEAQRGQLPVTPADLAQIPYVLESYDRIQPGSTSKSGGKSVVYIKKVNGVLYYVERFIAGLRSGNKRLTGVTMWKKPSAGGHATLTAPLSHTSGNAGVQASSDTNVSNESTLVNEDARGKHETQLSLATDVTEKAMNAAGRKISRAVELTTAKLSPERQQTVASLKKHFQEFWKPFSTVPDGDKALAARHESMGNVAKAVRFIDALKTELDAFPPDVKKDIFWYLNGDIPLDAIPLSARDRAQNIRRRTEIIGEMLVDRGILTQETFDAHKGQYVHYMYAKHIVGEDAPVGITSSGKLDLSYTLQRNPNLTMAQRRELGLIEDASVAVPVGMGKALTDIAKYDYLETIAENPDWVWQPSVVKVPVGKKLTTPVRGRTRRYIMMGIGKLQEQVKTYDEMMRVRPSPAVAEIHQALVAAWESVQKKTENAPEDFIQLPNTRGYGPLAGAFVRKPIADDLRPVMDADVDRGKLLNTVVSVHRQGMAMFKMGKVALNLPTACRNIFSNIIQNNMRGRPLAKIPGDIIAACESMKAKDAYYEEAFGMGLFNTNWFTTEINDVLEEFRKAESGRLDKVLTAIKNVAKYYGKIDDISKFAIFKQLRTEGKPVDEAALEAMKWGMDYSLTSRSIKGLRQTIVPFATYQYKIAPLIAESLKKRPWVLAKFALIYPAAKLLAMALHDLDDDDWDDLQKQLPAYVKKSGSMMILPWKTDKGQWQWVNTEYFFPWGNMLAIFRDAKELDMGEALRDLGISNPFLSMFYTGLSARDDAPPRHAYFGTPIYNDLDPAPMKVAKYLEYMANTWMPSMLTRQGAAGYTGKWLAGGEDRWGREVSAGQALGRWFGINMVAVSPEQSRAQASVRIQELRKEMSRIDADPSRSEENKEAYHARLNARLAEVAEEAPAAVLPITKAKGHDPVYEALKEMAARGTLRTSPPSRSMEISGVPVKMSMEQYKEYLDKSSEIARRKLGRLVESPAWETMTDQRKTEVVSGVVANARKDVRQKIKAATSREKRAAYLEQRISQK